MIILMAAITSIPPEIMEAATIDGANELRKMIHITLPLLSKTIMTLFILCFIGKMKMFDFVWTTTHGGPMGATETIATYMVRKAFFYGSFDMGYSAAIATLLFIAIFGPAMIAQKLKEKI